MLLKFFFVPTLLLTLNINAQDSLKAFSEEFAAFAELTSRPHIGNEFPSFSFKTTDSIIVSNSSIKSKVVFINFWFEACAPCIAEFDALNELYQKLKGNEKFEFISFTFETPEAITKIREKYGLQYKVVSIKREECYRLNQQNGFPTSMIIDKKGIIRYLVSGMSTEKEEVRDYIMNKLYPKILQEL